MRSAVLLAPLAVVLTACNSAPQSYENPPLITKIDRQRMERDNCLLAYTPQLDDGGSDIRGVARRVASSCSEQTDRLIALSIPYPDERAREGFRQEAVRRAADIVVTYRRVDSRPVGRPVGEPTPLIR